jgi:hypothetical protein
LYGRKRSRGKGLTVEHVEDLLRGLRRRWFDVVSLMHINRESRRLALQTYRLDCESLVSEESIPWWNEDDVLYFPKTGDPNFDTTTLRWMSQPRTSPFGHLASVRHIALKISDETLESLGLPPDHRNWNLLDLVGTTDYDYHFLHNFPSLSSVILLFDPLNLGEEKDRGC